MCQTPISALNIQCYRQPLVRDLAWLILAPDLLATPCAGRPTLEELGLDTASLADFLDRLERQPEALAAYVGTPGQLRLGLHYERLWQFVLRNSPGTQLLAHNLAILRDKRTLGELDLLYRRQYDNAVVHLEVAIKFYLGLESGPGHASSQARWIGPGGVDSLAIKRERLHRHQLPLIDREETQAALSTLAKQQAWPSPTIQQRMAMPGVLFYPWRSSSGAALLPPPDEAASGHMRGIWLAWRDWPMFRGELTDDLLGIWLKKPHWLAMPHLDSLMTLDALETHLAWHFTQREGAVQLALLNTVAGEWQRLFVVADSWPRQVPLPP